MWMLRRKNGNVCVGIKNFLVQTIFYNPLKLTGYGPHTYFWPKKNTSFFLPKEEEEEQHEDKMQQRRMSAIIVMA